jgi:hypothetical protein
MGRAFAREKGLSEFEEEFAKGAQIAQNPLAYESLPLLNAEDRDIMRDEVLHKWRQPFTVRLSLQSPPCTGPYVDSVFAALRRRRLLQYGRGCTRNGRIGHERRQPILGSPVSR